MMIFKIAKTELKNLFYSPVAWFLAVAFMVKCAVYYFIPLTETAGWQEVALKNMPKFKDFGIPLTMKMFMDDDSFFRNALQNLYLFIPLLTMGLISREVNNGTIKLLYSSPVTTREIVLGKFLSMMLYNLLLVSIIGIFMVLAGIHIQHTDFGFLFSAVLGFYLLVCTYSAIGLYMSSLSNYQIVAAIGSFIVILVLSRIGDLWQKYELVKDLTYFLSISGRTSKMLLGLITTKDVLYFLLIIFMFLGFTIIKMRSGRESKSWKINVARYSGVMVIVLITGYFSSLPGFIGYWDTTARQINTLNPNIQQIVKQLNEGPLEVTLYVNLLGPGAARAFPEERNKYLADVWEPYLRFKPDMKFNYVYYYDVDDNDSSYYKSMPGKSLQQIVDAVAPGYGQPPSLFMPPTEIRKMVNLRSEAYRLVMELKYNGRRTFLRTFNDPDLWPKDEQMAPALKRLLKFKPPKILFLAGNFERDIYNKGDRDYQRLVTEIGNRVSLLNLGFEVDSLETGNEIPTDIAALVLADPRSAYDPVTRKHIKDYIDKGGNMLVLGEPGKQDIINPVLEQIGVHLQAGSLIGINKAELPNMVRPYVTRDIVKLIPNKLGYDWADNLIKKDTLQVLDMPGTAGVVHSDTSDFKANTILATMPGRYWVKKRSFVTDSAAFAFNAKEGDTKSSYYSAAMSLTRKVGKKEQRIIVCGDADFLSSGLEKGTFIGRSFFAWFSYGEFPVYSIYDQPKDSLLRLNITSSVTKVYYIIFVWLIPALVALMGAIFLIRRNRQ